MDSPSHQPGRDILEDENNDDFPGWEDAFVDDTEYPSDEEEIEEEIVANSSNHVPNYLEDEEISRLIFNSYEEAGKFYKEYGIKKGFDTRIQTHQRQKPMCKDCEEKKASKRPKDCEACYNLSQIEALCPIINIEWVCHYEGNRKAPKPGYVRKRKAKPDLRCGCLARLRVSIDHSSGKFKVIRFEPAHTHILDPRDTMRCNRYFPPADKNMLTLLTESGMRTYDVLNFFELLARGAGNLTFKRKDGYNHIHKLHMEMIKDGDVNTAVRLLKEVQEHDKNSVFQHDLDDDGVLTRLFWCDGMSRAEYALYGDIIIYDSTYRTNKYKFPLVVFSGINNHGNNCVFGAALVNSETIESYQWVLKAFLHAMNEKPPSLVLTDQDSSMCVAIKSEFPNARHRLCSWHLTRNASSNVSKKFSGGFARLLERRCSKNEFNESWARLIKRHEVEEKPWEQLQLGPVEQLLLRRKMVTECFSNLAWFKDFEGVSKNKFTCRSNLPVLCKIQV